MARSPATAAHPAPAAPSRLSSAAPTAGGVFLLALAVYVATAPRTLTWAQAGSDGGELIAAAATLGVPHPPGYPLYTLLGYLVFQLPGGTPAFRFHIFSAVAMAGAAALMTLTLQQAQRAPVGRLPAAAAGLCFALAPLVWGQAIIAEVYALNALLLAALLWALRTGRSPILRGLLLGVAITTHLTSLLLLPWVAASLRRRHEALQGAGGLLLGLLPLALPPIFAAGNSPVVWGDPTTMRGWWWLVGGELYRPNVLALPPKQWLPRLLDWGPQLLAQFSWFGLPLLLLGGWTAPPGFRRELTWLLLSAGAYLVYAFGYRPGDALVHALPALLLLSHVLAFGLRHLRGVALLLPLLLLALHFDRLNLRADQGAAPPAEATLTAAPAGAVLLTPGDQSLFALWYFQLAEEQRADLILVDANLLAFDWYRARLQRLHPELTALDRDDVDRFIAANQRHRPVCHAALTAHQPLRCRPDPP